MGDSMHLSLLAQVIESAARYVPIVGEDAASGQRFDAGLPLTTHTCNSDALGRQELIDQIHLLRGDSRRGRAQATRAGNERARRPPATARFASLRSPGGRRDA